MTSMANKWKTTDSLLSNDASILKVTYHQWIRYPKTVDPRNSFTSKEPKNQFLLTPNEQKRDWEVRNNSSNSRTRVTTLCSTMKANHTSFMSWRMKMTSRARVSQRT